MDQEPAIIVRKPGSPRHLTPQNNQLMSECRILCFKPTPRLEWRDQDGQDEAEQCKHYVDKDSYEAGMVGFATDLRAHPSVVVLLGLACPVTLQRISS